MPEDEVELSSMLADAKLGVAESLAWSCALVSLPGTYAFSQSWILAVVCAGMVSLLATYRYRREANAAEDCFYRRAGRGRYSLEQPKD